MDYNGSQLAHLLSLIWTENSHILLEGFVSLEWNLLRNIGWITMKFTYKSPVSLNNSNLANAKFESKSHVYSCTAVWTLKTCNYCFLILEKHFFFSPSVYSKCTSEAFIWSFRRVTVADTVLCHPWRSSRNGMTVRGAFERGTQEQRPQKGWKYIS